MLAIAKQNVKVAYLLGQLMQEKSLKVITSRTQRNAKKINQCQPYIYNNIMSNVGRIYLFHNNYHLFSASYVIL